MRKINISFIADVDDDFIDDPVHFYRLAEKLADVMPYRIYNEGYREVEKKSKKMTTPTTTAVDKKLNLDTLSKNIIKSYCIGYLRSALVDSNRGKLDLHKKICEYFADILYGNSDDVFQDRMDFFEKFREQASVMTDNLDKCFGINFDFDNPSNKKIDEASSMMVDRFIKFADEAYKLQTQK